MIKYKKYSSQQSTGKSTEKKQFKKGTEIKIDANLVCFNRVEGHNFLYVFGAIKSNLGNVLKGM